MFMQPEVALGPQDTTFVDGLHELCLRRINHAKVYAPTKPAAKSRQAKSAGVTEASVSKARTTLRPTTLSIS